MLHGASGEGGSIHDVLELIGAPYAGARPDPCRAAWDKPTAKAIARAAGLSTPDSVALPRELFHDLGAAHRSLGLRDISRTDIIVNPSGAPHFLEVNVAPGMMETRLLPIAIAAAELDLGTV